MKGASGGLTPITKRVIALLQKANSSLEMSYELVADSTCLSYEFLRNVNVTGFLWYPNWKSKLINYIFLLLRSIFSLRSQIIGDISGLPVMK